MTSARPVHSACVVERRKEKSLKTKKKSRTKYRFIFAVHFVSPEVAYHNYTAKYFINMEERYSRATQINFAIISKLWLPLLLGDLLTSSCFCCSRHQMEKKMKWKLYRFGVRLSFEKMNCIIKIERQTMKTMNKWTGKKKEKRKTDIWIMCAIKRVCIERTRPISCYLPMA